MRIGLGIFALIALSAACPAWAGQLHVGYQRYGTLILLKERGTLEPALAKLGWTVSWSLFPAGPPLMEALNAGAVDVGIVGETPPVFAAAAGTPFVYLGVEPDGPTGEAVLVPRDSPVTSVVGLKGKRIAYTRGSNANWLLLRVLARAGLGWDDVTPVNLAPADGPAAFSQGAVDAWSVWDPYQASAIATLGARVLRDGTGLVRNRQFFVGAKGFAVAHPDVVRVVMAQVAASDAWSAAHRADVAGMLGRATGLPLAVVQASVARLPFGVRPMDADAVAAQQVVADGLLKAGLIPQAVSVKDAVPAAGFLP